ncbi:N6-adenosine-methyltransferase ime4, partial [Danaus plexippus plexippus]
MAHAVTFCPWGNTAAGCEVPSTQTSQ